ncbi:DUF1800 domain-containing protein [Ottowia testudinis]|uniref:DUF1800 domain-containing protein n=1 Tax=Ottowia testudinis TaxID=2816950 RepID=A0A975CEB5_9BURK|nr:DUF1800 domain-containing protein [Ottowia testudinis]QTD44665.1 DUF1800 domain-containing protein [Ottowia testudinis]
MPNTPRRPEFFRRAFAVLGMALAVMAGSAAHADDPSAETAATWRALSRLGYGPTPALIEQVQRAGGARAWALREIDAAFAASQKPIPLAGVPGGFNAPLPEIFERYREEREQRRERRDVKGDAALTAMLGDAPPRYSAQVARQAAAWRLTSCSRPDVESPLLARLTEFWFNHLNVSSDKGTVKPLVGHYVAHAIRPHALGRFDELLLTSARHPAMLNYLDQAQSVAEGTVQGERRRGLNENYARELMELHTLGVNGGYTQADVRELARMLTGWTVDPQSASGFRFAARRHDSGAKTVLGQRFGGGSNAHSGEAEGIDAIRMLAARPATARRVALRLAQWFVADAPPPALVDELARTFQTSGGDTRAVLRALVQSPAFWNPAHQLFKTPYDFACSALAAVGGPQDERDVQQTLGQLQNAGQGVHRWPTPDGYKTDRATWLAPEALTRRADFALQLARREPPVDFLARFAQPATLQRIQAQPAKLRAGLLLASPDFMNK